MRTIPGSALALLASQEAIEPINVIEIQWVEGLPTLYADKMIGNIPGRILSMGDIDDAQRSDSSGTTGSLSVTLDDVDGSIKRIFDTVDIHLKKVNVYQTFNELGLNNKFLVLSGQISAPMTWDEGKRELSFDIVTKIEDQEVGWSAEMGSFELVSQDLMGKPWPMAFGTVQHIPALQLQNIPTAFTSDFFALADNSLDNRIKDLLAQKDVAAYNQLTASARVIEEGGEPLDDETVMGYGRQQQELEDQITLIRREQARASVFVKGSVPLIPTVNVTQPFYGRVRVGNNLFLARINNLRGELSCVPLMTQTQSPATGASSGSQFYDTGTQVVIADNYPIQFVVSIIPGTVKRVWAMRSFNGLKKMAVVPPKYYTVSVKNYGGQNATVVTLKKPLSTVAMEENLINQTWENNMGQYMAPHQVNAIDWEDQLYVTYQSSIGPNPVDIMEYLINTYTHNTFDPTTFAAVKTLLASSPMNFRLESQENVMSVLTEIAYQARCIIFLRNDVFYLIYLPQIPTPVDTLTEDDIIVGSMQITTTPTENLVTKYIATYKPDYSPEFSEPVKVILRFNINKYGTHTEQHDFSYFNTFYATERAAAFWMIRKSNTFKILKAKLLITKLNLEVFDAVTLSFDHPYLSTNDVIGILTSVKYNSTDHHIDVEIWTPVRAGEMIPYTFAWPAGLTRQDIFPTYRDIQSGAAGGTGGGGAQLPPSNPNRSPIGVVNDEIYVRNGQTNDGLNDRLNWTLGPAYLGDDFVEQPLPDPNEQSQRYTPFPEGKFFKADIPDLELTEVELGEFPDACPVRIVEYAGKDEENENISLYKCEAYINGLDKKPKMINFGQLQIDPDERIPPDTWAIGVCLPVTRESEGGTTYIAHEYYIQVPIWLG